MRGLRVLAWLCLGACAQSLKIPSPRKQGAVDATAGVAELPGSQEQGFAGPRRRLQEPSDLCGNLVPVEIDECPDDLDLATCDNVACGELCEGDGECGTDGNLDNCGAPPRYDIYRKDCGTVQDTWTDGAWKVSAVSQSCTALCESNGAICSSEATFRRKGDIDSNAEVVTLFESLTGKQCGVVASNLYNWDTVPLFYSTGGNMQCLARDPAWKDENDFDCDASNPVAQRLCWCSTPATCESYSVSGAKHRSAYHGTYVAKGECEGKTLYECANCDGKLFYGSKADRWYISEGGCGSTLVSMHTMGNNKGDLGFAQWTEWSGSEWVDAPTISVQCDCVPSYVVSGAVHQTTWMGTYVADGTCDGKTLYKCEDCSSSTDAYLYWYPPHKDWKIGPNGCGVEAAWLFGTGYSENPDDPSSPASWYESNKGWVKTPTISLERSCAPEGAHGLNFAAIVGEAASELFTQNIAMMLIIVMLCGAVVAFLHFPRKQPRKNADETPLLNQGGEAL